MYAQTQLPVSCEQIDPTMINHNLPNGNDVFPPLRIPQAVPEQVIRSAIAMFRTILQTRASKTNLHCFVYNLMQSNRFNNPLFIEWCQRVVDFAEFLAVQQGQMNTAQQVVEKSSGKIYMGALFIIASQYPAVAQRLDPAVLQSLQQAGQEFQHIQNDVAAFQRVRGMSSGMAGFPQQQPVYQQQPMMGGAQLPPVGSTMGYGQPMYQQQAPMQAQLNQYAVNSQASYQQPQQPAPTLNNPSQRGSGLYMEQNPGQPIPTSWDANKPLNQTNTTITSITPPPGQVEPVVMDLDVEVEEGVPQTADQFVIDPYAYTPKGHQIDLDRPYDVIYAPGGVEARPAYLTNWKRTMGDDQPYSTLYDPARYVLFYVKWPDGVIKEKLVEYTEKMEYIRHEINDQLRAKARKSEGLLVASTTNIVDLDGPAQPIEVVGAALAHDEHLEDLTAMSPVILEGTYSGATDLENEHSALQDVQETLNLPDSQGVPAHEYHSIKFYPMDISEECRRELEQFKEKKTFTEGADALKRLLTEGLLSIRYYRFLNERLTASVNTYLKDSLSIEGISIDDFVEDAPALGAYLGNRRSREIQHVFEASAQTIFMKNISVASDDTGGAGIVDEYTNFQLPWMESDIAFLNIDKEPVLISAASHPKLLEVIKDMLKRATEDGVIQFRRMRLITSDGIYFEVIRGKLVEKAILLKKL